MWMVDFTRKLSVSTLLICLIIVATYARNTDDVLSGKDMVQKKLLNSNTGLLSAKDTEALVKEAEAWRWGYQNHSIDDRRALSLYWAAASGEGPATGVALNQLAWLHLVPSKLTTHVDSLSHHKQSSENVLSSSDVESDVEPMYGSYLMRWAVRLSRKYFGIHLSQLWLFSMARRFGLMEPKSDSEFQFSDTSKVSTIPASIVNRDVEAAVALWEKAAIVGNPDAQYALATHMSSPAFLGKDENTEATSLVRSYFAALGGTTLAQMSLGYKHLMGYGLPKSCESSRSFYELAANQAVVTMRSKSGDYPGLIVLPPGEALGVRLSELGEKAVKESDKEVVDYFEAAALGGEASAALNLGHIYLSGSRGVTQDVNKAIRMYRRAFSAKGGSGGAAGVLGALVYGGVGVAKSCEHAAEIWRVGELSNDPASLTGLGVFHSNKCGKTEANITRAIEYWEKGAHKGHMDALYLLGMHYLKTAEGTTVKASSAAQALSEFGTTKSVDDDNAGEGRAYAKFLEQLSHREAVRVAAQSARHKARLQKSEASLNQRRKEAELNQMALDQPKEEAIFQSEAEFADREEARWAKADKREETRLESEARLKDQSADDAKATTKKKKDLEAEAKMLAKTVTNQLHKAVSCLSTAAQHGHVLALHQMGILHGQGRGVAQSCASAVSAFKAVAERGDHSASTMQAALALWKDGDGTGARALYASIAEAGVEVAQSNAAWLLEQGLKPGAWDTSANVCGVLSVSACERAALRLWKQAAKQMNAEAALMVGDYSYYGRGDFNQTVQVLSDKIMHLVDDHAPSLKRHLGCEGDPASAAKYYSMAADMKSPQALYNLAFMYHWGIGVERDVHLAKRYYDTSSATHPHASWPAQAGLFLLTLESLISSPTNEVKTSAPSSSSHHKTLSQPIEVEWGNLDISWSDELAAVDTFALVILSAFLLLVIRLRNHHREHRRLLADGTEPHE